MEENKIETNQPTPQQSGGNKTIMIVLIVLVVLIIIGFGGCYMAGKFITNKAKNVVTNSKISVSTNENGEKVTTTVDAAKGQSWPTEIPTTIPKFTYGKIIASAVSDKIWVITISEISESNYTAYKETLKSKGWIIDGEVNTLGIMTFSAKNSDGLVITGTTSVDDNNARSILLGINLQKN